ncbi:MAG: MMPL family transporter [Myxococcales bacterium]|nr:MMPL family transporter [Myxococcales bacterium]
MAHAPQVPRALSAGLTRVARFGVQRPAWALAVVALLSVLAGLGVQRLRLDTDLARLLPDRFESVQDLHALEARAGAIGYVVVVVEGGDVAARRAYAAQVAPAIEALDSIRFVDVERPVQWFEDHALYFLDLPDLRTVADRLAARAAFEKRRHNPMYLDLEKAAPPSLDLSDVTARYTSGEQRWLARQTTRYYEDAQRLVLLARPAQRATDMAFAQRVTGDVQGVLDAQPPPAGVTTALTGRYQKKIDQKAHIQGDLSLASSLALALTLLYLLAHFRRLRALLLVVGPLLVGLWWTFGVAGAVFGTLNILTAFIGAILLGLGVDHGIHLLSGWRARVQAGLAPGPAVEAAFAETGRGVVVAAVTTIAAFIGVGLSGFRAFHEFGWLAAAGMACVVLAYALVLPALVVLLPPPKPEPATAADASPVVSRLSRRPVAGLMAAAVALAVMVWPASGVRFDYDFAALEDANLPSFRLDQATNRLLGYSQTPTVVLTDDAAQARAVAAAARADDPTGAVDMTATLADLVPADQAQKRPVIERIGRIVRRVKPQWLDDPDHRDARERLLRAAQAKPFTVADLPDAVRRQFGDADGGGYVLVFPAISLSDGARVGDFAAAVRGAARATGPRLPAAGEAMVLADILAMVRAEGPRLLGFTAAAVFLALWVLLGHLGRAALALGAAVVTLAATLGVAAAAGLPLNYLNLVMVPVIVGLAVDGAAHFLGRDDAEPAGLVDLGRAVGGALLTTAFGFGALTVADHPGLESLGRLALIGLAVNALVSLWVLPALATLLAVNPTGAPQRAPEAV